MRRPEIGAGIAQRTLNPHSGGSSPPGEGERLDRRVAALPIIGSRSKARAAIESGKVSVDGVTAAPGDAGRLVLPSQRIDVDMNRPGTSADNVRARRSMVDAGLRILFEDDDLIAIDKPPGVLTDTATAQQRRERGSVRAALEQYLRARGAHAHVVHRIDRDTSGVVLFAKNEPAEEALRKQFEEQRPERVYWAAVCGVPEPREGGWSDWMRWNAGKRIQEICSPEAHGGVLARANYKVIADYGDAAVIEVRLVTGRRNQIRLQCSLSGNPVIGERLYDRHQDPPRGIRSERQALHALRLTVVHPSSRKSMTFTAPLAPDLAALERELRSRAAPHRDRPVSTPNRPPPNPAAAAVPTTPRGDSDAPSHTARRPHPPRRPPEGGGKQPRHRR